MRPVRTIAAVVFASLTLLTAPAWATAASLRVSPRSVVAGEAVTVSGSVGPDQAGSECATTIRLLSRAFVHTQDFAGVPAVDAAVRPDGTFTAATTIPPSTAAGSYTISGRCGGGNIGASANLVVRAAAAATTTPAPTAPPVTNPPASHPQVPAATVAGPPGRPAAQPAGRWILPGLAALGGGTLAALAVWLLYRRRHPARPGR